MKVNLFSIWKTQVLSVLLVLSFFSSVVAQEDGKTLFKQNCGACHSLKDQVLVGPSLLGINDKRSEEWLIKWIKDSQKMIKDGDADAVKIYEEFGKQAMPPFQQLNDDQVKSILAFVKEPPQEEPAKAADAVATKPAAPAEEPWSPLVKVFVAGLFLVVLAFIFYVVYVKYKLKSLGLYSGTVPVRDLVSNWFSKNGSFVLAIVIALVLLLMKSCISSLMQ